MVCSWSKSPMVVNGNVAECLLSLGLAGELGDLDDDELRRFQRREGDDDVDDPVVDVRLGRRLAVALHLKCLARRIALEGALTKKSQHECLDARADGRPQRLVI